MQSLTFRIGFLSLLVSCHSFQKEKRIATSDTATVDSRKQRQFADAMDNITAKLNLQNLKKGVDSFELRIWCLMSADVQNIITIRYIYSQWNISETYVWETYPDRQYRRNDTANHLLDVIIDSTKSKSIHPKIDKGKFIDTLLRRYIFNFPEKADFEGSFGIGYDSYRYIFEIAEKNKYNMLDYDCGGEIYDKEELHDKIKNLLNFIRRQLDEKIPQCN
jgi:hypothetical protein